MSNDNPTDLFDEYYYAHNCGRPYQRDDEWLKFFDGIAERIATDIQPKSVLDAGCAWGFLVEGLRARGIEAYGVDVSEYAIQNVHESIKPYCWIGSITDPFPQNYELIVSIEVLEHMQKKDAEKALVNLDLHTDQILFSSTPFDYRESTHFNVQDPHVWAELFARMSFYRDVDFDASFITPWAVLFKKQETSKPRLIKNFERKYWSLWKENLDLRSLCLDLETKIKYLENLISLSDQKKDALQSVSQELEKKEQLIKFLIKKLSSQVNEINNE